MPKIVNDPTNGFACKTCGHTSFYISNYDIDIEFICKECGRVYTIEGNCVNCRITSSSGDCGITDT